MSKQFLIPLITIFIVHSHHSSMDRKNYKKFDQDNPNTHTKYSNNYQNPKISNL